MIYLVLRDIYYGCGWRDKSSNSKFFIDVRQGLWNKSRISRYIIEARPRGPSGTGFRLFAKFRIMKIFYSIDIMMNFYFFEKDFYSIQNGGIDFFYLPSARIHLDRSSDKFRYFGKIDSS